MQLELSFGYSSVRAFGGQGPRKMGVDTLRNGVMIRRGTFSLGCFLRRSFLTLADRSQLILGSGGQVGGQVVLGNFVPRIK